MAASRDAKCRSMASCSGRWLLKELPSISDMATTSCSAHCRAVVEEAMLSPRRFTMLK